MRITCAIALLVVSTTTHANLDFRGSVGVEARYFSHADEFQSSAFIEPDWYWEKDSSALKIKAFARVDALDSERTHADIREAFYQYVGDTWELRAGINKVFWGVTESQHLVDVINQTDYLEGFDGEDKLGQPMVQFTFINSWGVVDTFILPYFREREFAGKDGHFNFATSLTTEDGPQTFNAHFEPARYESSREEHHLDVGLRYSHSLGSWDLGVSYFAGTRRDPLLDVTSIDAAENIINFTPFYGQMEQIGFDLQATLGAWLWKAEAISRWQETEDYTAAVVGFEYTRYGINDQGSDLGILVELNWDERGNAATTPMQNDLFVGGRLTWNDAQSFELLAGVIQDLDASDRYTTRVRTSRRLGNAYRLAAELWIFNNKSPEDLAYNIRNEDFFQLSLEKFF